MITLPKTYSRRDALRLAALTAAGLAASPAVSGDETPAAKPSLHVYPNYGWVRGFGIVPSWAANVVDAWRLYDGARFREEVALARTVHANSIRLWFEYAAWKTDPAKMTERFLDAVAGIAENGMKVMPCLFNHWHDRKLDYGGTSAAGDWTPHLEYVKTIVSALAQDERVFIWDLCNEPGAREPGTPEVKWLTAIAATARSSGARQPITIGTMSGVNIMTFAPLVDVLNGHPYAHNRPNLKVLVDSFTAMSKETGKPFIVNETIPGALDDLIRAEVAKLYVEMLSEAGFGWMGWVIKEGLAIATTRELHDGNGINGGGYHPFFTKEGKLRDGLEFLNEKPKLRAPWEKN